MRAAHLKSRYIRDLKVVKRRGWDIEKLNHVVAFLMREGRLPLYFRPHRLKGKYAGLWECHVGNDWLLIYDITDDAIVLSRTGSHTDLFE